MKHPYQMYDMVIALSSRCSWKLHSWST